MGGEWRFKPEWNSWNQMIRRCHQPNHKAYPLYGGRGISVCPRWRESFIAFLHDLGRKPNGHTLDRKDPNGNYDLGNCRWATRTEQNRTSRKAKLNEEVAKVMRHLYGKIPTRLLAAVFSTQRQTVTRIVRGKRWA